MPLISCGTGSVISLDRSCFQVGRDPSSLVDDNMGDITVSEFSVVSKKSVATLHSRAIATSKDTKPVNARNPPKLPSKLRSEVQSGQKLSKGPLYTIRATFEKPSMYFILPYQTFVDIWEDKSLVMPAIKKDIMHQLAQTNDCVFARIENLKPWIEGQMGFRTATGSYGKATEATGSSVESKALTTPASVRRSVGGSTIGSFFKSNNNQNDLSASDLQARPPEDNNINHSYASNDTLYQSMIKPLLNSKAKNAQLRKDDVFLTSESGGGEAVSTSEMVSGHNDSRSMSTIHFDPVGHQSHEFRQAKRSD